jgi:hypothetical protein
MLDYLRMFAGELGDRILQTYPALQQADDPLSPRLASLLRRHSPPRLLLLWVSRKSGRRIAVLL